METGGLVGEEAVERAAQRGKLKRALRQLTNWATWKILLVAVLLFPLALTLLRIDNLRMEEKRDAVLAADAAGDDAALVERLDELKAFVFGHMNTSTGPFYLVAAYTRQAENIVNSSSAPEQNIYKEASAYCDPKFNYRWSWAYVECMKDELNKHGSSAAPGSDLAARLPNPELYRREFLAPFWTPTAAGILLLLAALLLIVVICRLISWLVLSVALKIIQKKPKSA